MKPLTLQQAIEILRNPQYPQLKDRTQREGNCLCALSLIGVQSGFAKADPDNPRGLLRTESDFETDFLSIGLVGCGLTDSQAWRIVSWNDDDGLTFPQIADKIEAGELDV